MVQNIYIGIDGGASKCKVRIEDEAGHLLGQAMGGPANVRLSVDKTWEAIYHSIETVLASHHMTLTDTQYRFHVGMGLAGCEVIEARQDFLSRPHPFATLQLISDAHVACLGAHGGKDGSIIIIGTGVIGYQIERGEILTVGGWGFPHDDEGGGAWLGLEAARLTFQSVDGRIAQTPLLTAVLDFFQGDTVQFSTFANKANSSEFARLAPLVIQYSQAADPHAIALMQRAAAAINLVGDALAQHSTLPCSLFGGVAPFVEPWLSPALRSRLQPRLGDANVGAIYMIRDVVQKKQKDKAL